MTDQILAKLSPELQTRLNLIIQTMDKFWEYKIHQHFTYQGHYHSEMVLHIVEQLISGLPEKNQLNSDELFILSASVWLYEIGMQSPNLSNYLDFNYQYGEALPPLQLRAIRDQRHLLTKQMIYDSVRNDYPGKPLNLGLLRPPDDYIFLIAEVCRWCSNDPLDQVPDFGAIKGKTIRIRFLVALLRLADQLYIDPSRVNLDLLERANLPINEFAYWWAYHYTQILPISNAQILFQYCLPSDQEEFLGYIRALIEPKFEFRNNPTIQYLWDTFQLHLIAPSRPSIRYVDKSLNYKRPMCSSLLSFLEHNNKPLPIESNNKTKEMDIETQPVVKQYGDSIPKILLITATPTETQGVLQIWKDLSEKPWQRKHIRDKTYYSLGEIGGAEILLVQSEMGTSTAGGTLLTTHKAIESIQPKAVIMVGIAFGTKPKSSEDPKGQSLGDILVAKQIMCYEPGKIKGKFKPRGDRVTVSTQLLDKFHSGEIDWTGAPVQFGLILSGEKLVNDLKFRTQLLKIEPEAIGGEMEGAGLYVAANDAKVDWILVKAICDWADGNKNDDVQPLAAFNAAKFVLHVLQIGGFSDN